MSTTDVERLRSIKTFPSLVKYLRDELDWPIELDHFDDLDPITFDYEPEELGIDSKIAVKIKQIKRLRRFCPNQPWGVFFVNFVPKRLPVTVLRRILQQLVPRKRASASRASQQTWQPNDLLFVSAYGEDEQRQISFAHFAENKEMGDLPVLKVLGWDKDDTAFHLADAHDSLKEKLSWPNDEEDVDTWRRSWSSAFVLRHREVVDTSKNLAIELADLATNIRMRVNQVLVVEDPEKGPMRKLMAGFKEVLIHDLSEDDFADTYAQTIAYGLLAAAISRHVPGEELVLSAENIADMVPVTNPFLKDLLGTFLTVGGRKKKLDFDELGINEIIDLLRNANLTAVLHDFGNQNPLEDPVIHFYELFLKEYDAKKRMQRGVFYTPRPVVSFIVRSVHELLQKEFGLEDGLADTTTWGEMSKKHKDLKIPEGAKPGDPFVTILDPATGTGTFLVEVIELVHKTMVKKWKAEGHTEMFDIPNLWNDYVPKHLLSRLHGFELMMAPYAIAHMRIGLKLGETGYKFNSSERARIYLTNALEPASDLAESKAADLFEALGHEAQAVNAIKQDQRFTVVIGNPPYAKSQTEGDWIDGLMRRYREGLDERKSDTNREEWKFLRYATHQIDNASVGVASYVINNSFLGAPTLRELRRHLLEQFGTLSILNLHGDANIGEVSPDGSPDWNVFDIKQGVCIAALLRRPLDSTSNPAVCQYGELWGEQQEKYGVLLEAVTLTSCDEILELDSRLTRFLPRDRSLDDEYFAGNSIAEVWRSVCGIETKRDHFAIDFDRASLQQRIESFSKSNLPEKELKAYFGIRDNDWIVMDAKRRLNHDETLREAVVPCVYRPFDVRWVLYLDYVLARDRGALMAGMNRPNLGLVVPRQTKEEFGALSIHSVCTHKIVSVYDRSFLFPLYSYLEDCMGTMRERVCNVDSKFLRGLAGSIGLTLQAEGASKDLAVALGPEDFFNFVYAELYSLQYRKRYGDLLRIDFPRIFTPKSVALFRSLVELGEKLITLHLLKPRKVKNHSTTPLGSGNFQVEKVSYSDETVWIDKAKTRGFRGVPEEVWNFHIGGYQVCEKWLKDRQTKGGKNPRPGRVLTDEDIDHYQRIVVALNETIRIMAEIDEVIEQHGGWPNAFVTDASATKGTK